MTTPSPLARGLGVAMALLIGLAGCSKKDVPTSPSPPPSPSPSPAPAPPPPPAAPLTTVNGTAFEYSASGSRRPAPNLRLKVRQGSRNDGAVGGIDLPDVVTDADGRYEITDVTSGLLFLATPPGSASKFLCDFHPLFVPVLKDLPFLADLPLVPATWAGTQVPSGMGIPGTSVHGVVSERVGEQLRPVADATVTLDNGLQDPPAKTSASGFYMICSVVGTDQYRTITARKADYRDTSREIFGGEDFLINLELVRK
jgi:hypothetical protein